MSINESILIAWLCCAPLGYIFVRDECVRLFGRWTQLQRVEWLLLSLFYGPFILLVVLLMRFAEWANDAKWSNKEAKW